MEARFFATVALLFFAGGLLMALTHRVHSITRDKARADWIKYAVFAGVILFVLTVGLLGRWPLSILIALVAIGSAAEFSRHAGKTVSGKIVDIAAGAAIVAYCLSHLLFMNTADWWPWFAFVFVLVAITDSFAQLWGKLLGRHQLCPVLSPGKTWEGFLGGTLSAVAGAWLFGFLLSETPSSTLVVAGLTVSLAATAGDLLFSSIKRKLRIKDFSALLPEHGGLLDRFDSLIVAAPVFFWINRTLMP